MWTNILFFLLISSGSVFCIAFFKKPFEEILPITIMSIVLLIFVFGICGALYTGVIVSFVISIALYISSAIYVVKNKRIKAFITGALTPGFLIFLLVFFAFSVFNAGKLASTWDEFSHWIDIVKAMTTVDDFGTNPQSLSTFKSYPPAMSIFQYVLQKIYLFVNPNHDFNEWRNYLAYQIFAFSPFFPLMKNLSFRKPLKVLLLCLTIFTTPLLFYSKLYNECYIDPFLSFLSGTGIAMILLNQKKDAVYHITIFLLCATLVLSKDVGLLFAVFLAIAYGVDLWLHNNRRVWNKCGVLMICALASVLIPKFLWDMELRVSGVSKSFSAPIDFKALLKVILGMDDTYRTSVYNAYNYGMFDSGISLGNIPVFINYFALLIILLLGLYCLYQVFKHTKLKEAKTAGIIFLITAIQLVIYVLGLNVTYMFKFSEYEALTLASLNRYLNIAFLATWLVFILCLINLVIDCLFGKRLEVLIIGLILIITPCRSLLDFSNGTYIKSSISTREPYVKLTNEIKEHCKNDSSIYFISQDTSGFDFWVTRFNIRPCTLNPNFTWAIGETDYEDGRYTVYYTAKEWQRILIEDYNYVALYKLNNYFYEHYSMLFENPSEISENTLYWVNKSTGQLEKCD